MTHFFGFMANRRRAELLPIGRSLIESKPQQPSPPPEEACEKAAWACPLCGGPISWAPAASALLSS
jgi:hypothetical protein